ncbi:MAG: AraC family transcriptional regulator [Verrucomicrobiota bacterium]
MTTPERTTAAAYPRHLKGQVVVDSAALRWPGLFVRRYKFPRVVDRFLVPATAEPLISCQMKGSAVFKERDIGGNWLTHQLQRGTLFVTRSRTPYEVSFSSPVGEELENVQIHVSVDVFLAACRASVSDADPENIEVIDFFGRDEALAHLCFACAEMLAERVPAKSERVTHLTKLIASCLAEKYTTAATEKADFRGGLPVRQLRKVEDYVHERLADEISLESLAELAELSPFHFSRVFKQTTGMSPLQFVTRERITRAQQLIRETKRSLIEIALEVGYSNPSHFAKVFRKVAGVTPTEFRRYV